jgi:hypothetical protein
MSKNKKCTVCGRDDQPWFSKRRCKGCAMQSYKKPSKMTKKTATRKKEQSSVRDVYFETLIGMCRMSEESWQPIPSPTRANICHLFPKRRYKSVQANLDNHVFLTLAEHNLFDKLLDTHDYPELEEMFVNSWAMIRERMKKLLPLIEENGRQKMEFEKYLEQIKKNNKN